MNPPPPYWSSPLLSTMPHGLRLHWVRLTFSASFFRGRPTSLVFFYSFFTTSSPHHPHRYSGDASPHSLGPRVWRTLPPQDFPPPRVPSALKVLFPYFPFFSRATGLFLRSSILPASSGQHGRCSLFYLLHLQQPHHFSVYLQVPFSFSLQSQFIPVIVLHFGMFSPAGLFLPVSALYVHFPQICRIHGQPRDLPFALCYALRSSRNDFPLITHALPQGQHQPLPPPGDLRPSRCLYHTPLPPTIFFSHPYLRVHHIPPRSSPYHSSAPLRNLSFPFSPHPLLSPRSLFHVKLRTRHPNYSSHRALLSPAQPTSLCFGAFPVYDLTTSGPFFPPPPFSPHAHASSLSFMRNHPAVTFPLLPRASLSIPACTLTCPPTPANPDLSLPHLLPLFNFPFAVKSPIISTLPSSIVRASPTPMGFSFSPSLLTPVLFFYSRFPFITLPPFLPQCFFYPPQVLYPCRHSHLCPLLFWPTTRSSLITIINYVFHFFPVPLLPGSPPLHGTRCLGFERFLFFTHLSHLSPYVDISNSAQPHFPPHNPPSSPPRSFTLPSTLSLFVSYRCDPPPSLSQP